MATKAEIVSGLKQAKAELTQQLAGINAALAAFGAGEAPARSRGTRKAKSGGKGTGIQAAHDAMAVKRGTATPEQAERHAARAAAKAAKKTNGAAVPEGASLAEAAAS